MVNPRKYPGLQAVLSKQTGDWLPRMNNRQLGAFWEDMAYGDWGDLSDGQIQEGIERVEHLYDDNTVWVLNLLDVNLIEGHHSGHDASERYIAEYQKLRNEGSPFPPLIVERDPEHPGKFKTIDGQHRLFAAKASGERDILAYVPEDYPEVAAVLAKGLPRFLYHATATNVATEIQPRPGQTHTVEEVVDHLAAVSPGEGKGWRDWQLQRLKDYGFGGEWKQVLVDPETIDVEMSCEQDHLCAEGYSKLNTKAPVIVIVPFDKPHGKYRYWTIDGRHRTQAARLRGEKEILALVPVGHEPYPTVESVLASEEIFLSEQDKDGGNLQAYGWVSSDPAELFDYLDDHDYPATAFDKVDLGTFAILMSMEVENPGQGYGTKLLREFVAEAGRLGADLIVLIADTHNPQEPGFDLQWWYESKGFKPVDKSKHGTSLLMVLWNLGDFKAENGT